GAGTQSPGARGLRTLRGRGSLLPHHPATGAVLCARHRGDVSNALGGRAAVPPVARGHAHRRGAPPEQPEVPRPRGHLVLVGGPPRTCHPPPPPTPLPPPSHPPPDTHSTTLAAPPPRKSPPPPRPPFIFSLQLGRSSASLIALIRSIDQGDSHGARMHADRVASIVLGGARDRARDAHQRPLRY